MVFSSMVFLCIFLPVVFLLHLILPGIRAKNWMLLLASLVFYAYGEPVYVLLMIASAFVNYLSALLIEKKPSGKKAVMTINVILNLGVLVLFKYTGFLAESFNAIFGTAVPVPAIRLPIGISFFTFQAMSYVIDVYRGVTEPQKNFGKVLLYISFFPQLIAGPIVKYHDIAQEIENRTQTVDGVMNGIRRFIAGLSKKVLISNTVGLVADTLFAADISGLNAAAAWIGAISYMLQIYFDFSGYSDMAIGLGEMFGFHFKENFNYPYISGSITEFWRRWHMSLSSWFKEYVYIPLGGNRKGLPRQIRNILIVWLLTGIWHGAGWNFVVWGLYFGAVLILEKLFLLRCLNRLPALFRHIYALLLIMLGWAVFAFDSLGSGLGLIRALFGGYGQPLWDGQSLYLLYSNALLLVLLAVGSTPLPKRLFDWGAEKLRSRQGIAGAGEILLVGAGMLLSVAFLVDASYNPFLYFRF